jgi:anti-sigma B factor antagonist
LTPFEVSSRHEDGALVVACEGELDIATVDRVRAELVERGEGEALVIDLSALTFLDTSAIQLLVEAMRAARDEGFALRIVRAHPRVQRVFGIAGLETVLPFEDGPADG